MGKIIWGNGDNLFSLFDSIFSDILVLKGTLKKLLLCVTVFSTIYAFINYFILDGSYGKMDFFIFHAPNVTNSTLPELLRDLIVLAVAISSVFFLPKVLPLRLLTRIQLILFIVLLVSIIVPLNHLFQSGIHTARENNEQKENISFDKPEPKYFFSKNAKNVLIIFYDRFIGGFVPDILKDCPELKSSLQGFVWYPNTLSFYTGTIRGLPAIHGGYAFTNVPKERKKHLSLKNPGPELKKICLIVQVLPSKSFWMPAIKLLLTTLPFLEQHGPEIRKLQNLGAN